MHLITLVPVGLALALSPLGSTGHPVKPTAACSAATFRCLFEQLPGTSSISITAAPVSNYTTVSEPPASTEAGQYTVSFCNVTATYTHPRWNDTIHVTVQLPAAESWNGNLQALGGAGFASSMGTIYSVQAVAAGYSTVDTDSGHNKGPQAVLDSSWALASPGEINVHLVEDWSSVTLHEMAVVGKAAVDAFYGTKPKYSYFRGCSGGGRQGFAIAQEYAEDFDGILAAAPALNAHKFLAGGYYATQVMNDLGVYPPPCEFAAFTHAAIAACDELDGVKDGIISLPDRCDFDAQTVVGSEFDCNGTTLQFTSAGATIANAAWTGPRSDDPAVGWFGYNKDANLTSIVSTACTSLTTCSEVIASTILGLAVPSFQYLLAKDPTFDPTNMTDAQFFAYAKQAVTEYSSLLSSASPDLSNFHAAGGKLISWHGLSDNVIPVNGTIGYYQEVLAQNRHAHSFARFFEAPGVAHCAGGPGAIPNGAFDQLVSWVEDGVAPDTLAAVDPSGNTRNLCPYPLQQTYVGGDITKAASYQCAHNPVLTEPIAEEFAFFDAN